MMFLPAGSQDETGNQISNRLRANEIFRNITEERNFKPISTPVIEYANTFINPVAGMDLQNMLKWFNHEGDIEVLRPDWTAAVARAVANQHPSEQKWSYQGSVFRMDKDGTESRQAGIEMVHTDSFLGESECLLTAVYYLKSLSINQYVMELGHTKIFEEIIAPFPFSDKDEEALRIAMHDKRTDLVEQIVRDLGYKELVEPLTNLIDAYGSKEMIERYEQIWSERPELLTILEELKNMIQLLEEIGETEVIVDLGRVKNLPYYDGMMFRGFLTQNGATCFSGGRYDRLYKQFNQETTAVGLAFDVDILASQMDQKQWKEKICLLATPKTHAVAEKFRHEFRDKIVDIRYEITNNQAYDKVYDLVEDNSGYKVVER
ncbi:ATP phosphoribosyltransferase regulatory subunit [Gracilibacillus sp. YIM 98692]|uniref:ATP phosphoribosyltransferase regulatory subunit n=1 Tax=Gracilibacillus sp. YIM 98692 TaxID=2663532 RepID=UPI001F08A8E3|nr:ATP phosphoribosyltransferase regulatory subunit [Gracilibacillus sp. YIM 98692]